MEKILRALISLRSTLSSKEITQTKMMSTAKEKKPQTNRRRNGIPTLKKYNPLQMSLKIKVM